MVLIAGKKIDIRVSTIPTVHGEKIVMRLLYQDEKLMKLEHLGLFPEVMLPYEKMIQRSGGIILVTGPTGSGKTTTLYATLACIDHRSRNVITIEEPVEYKLSGYSQIEVNPKLGLTFAHSLRSVLRQDPDVIMVGETGTGKTLLARSIAKLLNVPFCIADATVLTEAGYVGEDVESILSRLLQAADYDVSAAEKGIVFIDEIDKVARKSDNPSITRDVSGEGVQQAMLKLLEGAQISVPPQGGRKHPEQKMVQINTKDILFVCGGAFDGISKIIERRVKSQSIGFNALSKDEFNEEKLLSHVNQLDIKKFGLIPELIGRFPVLTYLNPLTLSLIHI